MSINPQRWKRISRFSRSRLILKESLQKAVFVNFMPFEKDNLDKSKMIPWILDDYMTKRAAKAFKYDISDPVSGRTLYR